MEKYLSFTLRREILRIFVLLKISNQLGRMVGLKIQPLISCMVYLKGDMFQLKEHKPVVTGVQ